MPGVLVLVEQHRAVGGALGGTDLGVGVGHAGGDGELIGEVDRALGPFPRDERLHQRQQRHALALRRDPALVGLRRLGALPLAARRRLQRRGQPLGVRAYRARFDEVLPQLACQRQQPGRDGGGQHVDVQLVGPRADHPVRELPRRRLAQQPRRGLGGQPQGVLADQPSGVGVVGRDGRLAREQRGPPLAAGVELVEQPGARQPAQPRPDARPELLGGLAGERQAEDLLWQHRAGGDEPDDARGHRLGLARSGPRDDERRTARARRSPPPARRWAGAGRARWRGRAG